MGVHEKPASQKRVMRTFTLDLAVYKPFAAICQQQGKKNSRVIEDLMKHFVAEESGKNPEEASDATALQSNFEALNKRVNALRKDIDPHVYDHIVGYLETELHLDLETFSNGAGVIAKLLESGILGVSQGDVQSTITLIELRMALYTCEKKLVLARKKTYGGGDNGNDESV